MISILFSSALICEYLCSCC